MIAWQKSRNSDGRTHPSRRGEKEAGATVRDETDIETPSPGPRKSSGSVNNRRNIACNIAWNSRASREFIRNFYKHRLGRLREDRAAHRVDDVLTALGHIRRVEVLS